MTTIKCKKDLFNGGKCFTKNQTYQVSDTYHHYMLRERYTTNDQGQPHKIGNWDKHFKIIT